MKSIEIYYEPIDFAKDDLAETVAQRYGAHEIGRGFFIGGERDVQWHVADSQAESMAKDLKALGFRVVVEQVEG
jgi:hypothetical protein